VNEKIVLDTHILVWSLLEPDNIAKKIKEQIASAQSVSSLYISSITLWEIAMLIQKKRISVFERTSDFLKYISRIEGLSVIEISAEIAAESVMLPGAFSSDPADCIIIASTRGIAGSLITRDQKIIEWANQGYLKVIKG